MWPRLNVERSLVCFNVYTICVDLGISTMSALHVFSVTPTEDELQQQHESSWINTFIQKKPSIFKYSTQDDYVFDSL